jgi:cystathionine beta-lyase
MLLSDLLREHLPMVRYEPPEATYLAWIDCSELAVDGEPAKAFLERGRVALEPGKKFGTGGTSYVRLNFGTSSAILKQIVSRMAGALSANP